MMVEKTTQEFTNLSEKECILMQTRVYKRMDVIEFINIFRKYINSQKCRCRDCFNQFIDEKAGEKLR